MQINLGEARDRLSELVDAALSGETVTISKRGVPAVDLIPSKSAKGRVPDFESVKGTLRILDPDYDRQPQTDEELEAWMRGDFF
ncbi:MAG TPA: type II toxin-antitoxin system prevent-host-death family antitoxin [Bryobacteraceae bacterium]|jgi:prevent-host-death family protein|nr:type II toxin-antitoxin system prevent-host-death family antitoxin [Bryobacteraceae bacterium]